MALDYSENQYTYRHEGLPQENPVRVEIKENAKGDPSVSVRLTGENTNETADEATALYWRVKRGLRVKE